MKTVAICGSMRFQAEMQRIAFELEVRHSLNALQCVYNAENAAVRAEEKALLDRAQRRRIELSDAICVVDIGGYVGEAVRAEIEFARARGKEVIFHSEFERGAQPGSRQ